MARKRFTEEDLAKLRPGMVGPSKPVPPRLPAEPKPSKFNNEKVESDGIKFDSKKEAARYHELVLLERAGQISQLRRQVTFGLTVHGELVCNYIADFVYIDLQGKRIVEDVKSDITRKLPVYRIKNKLMEACHGIAINEI